MGGAEWNGAVALLKAWLAHQPAPMPIAILLAGAFAAVMFIEGFRANFIPARKSGKIQKTATRELPELKKTRFAKSSAPHTAASSRAIARFVPKPQPALRRVYGAPRPIVCHRIKLEMVNITPIEQPAALAEQG